MLDLLTSYVPQVVARRLVAHPAPLTGPGNERAAYAVLFADISGFTALTERLTERGPAGAEELTGILNSYFPELIALITAGGGDVVKFAGDALLALWRAADEDPALAAGPALAQATLRAAQCGLAVQARLHDRAVTPGIHLALRVTVAAGEISAAFLGGVYGRWEFGLAGEPLVEIAGAAPLVRPGEVALTPGARALLAGQVAGDAQGAGGLHLTGVLAGPAPRALVRVQPPAAAEPTLRSFIPAAVLARLQAGQTEWLAELRRVTVLFLNLPDLDHRVALPRAQAVVAALQTTLYQYEGSINKLSVDDKGVTLVAALGLPPLAHADDPVRGVAAALAMQEQLRAQGMRSAIGVTTGRVFCGVVGSDIRREYTMIGGVVNLAARLMQAAPGTILCDGPTMQAAQPRLSFAALPPLPVKGRQAPVAVYRPLGTAAVLPSGQALVGRAAERARFAAALADLRAGGPGGVILVEGEAGIGKSRLVEDVQHQAAAAGLPVLLGAGDAVEQAAAYHAWRPVVTQLLGVDPQATLGVQQAQALAALGDDPALVAHAALLNALLPLDLPETPITRPLAGQIRADNTVDLLVGILRAAAARQPLVLILDDAHWLDSASWAVAGAVAGRVHPLLLVLATRPLGAPGPAEYRSLAAAPGTTRLLLDTLTPADVDALICARLGVDSLPAPVAALIRERAEGHPFFSEELAYALRDSGLIRVEGRVCQLVAAADALSELTFPDTVQGVITSRIDRLTPGQQLTLKVASVIGRVFAVQVLRAVYPVAVGPAEMAADLVRLQQLDITPLDRPAPDLAYVFKHIITREVAYNLMLFAQRRALHRAVAEWHERAYPADAGPFYSILVYHWSAAEVPEKTLYYLERAGDRALYQGAFQEAAGFFEQALAAGPPAAAGRQAHWERQLGEAYLGLGRLPEARAHLGRAVDLLGWPLPASRARLVGALGREVLRQARHRLHPPQPAGIPAARRAQYRAATGAYSYLGEIFFYSNDPLGTLYTALRALNLAEHSGPTPELAQGYATIGTAAGLVPLPGLVRFYHRRARAVMAAVDDPVVLSWVLIATAVYHGGVGGWDHVATLTAEARALATRLGHWQRLGQVLLIQAQGLFGQGRFLEALPICRELAEIAAWRGDALQQGWGLAGIGKNQLRLGQTAAGIEALEAALAILHTREDALGEAEAAGLLAAAYQAQGATRPALQAAERAAALLARSGNASAYLLEAHAGVAACYLTLWERARRHPAAAAVLRRRTRQAVRGLAGFSRIFSVGGPRTHFYAGQIAALEGHPARARRAWQAGHIQAQALAMAYEQAQLAAALARLGAGGRPK
ncbi:MAG TPA: AAA family ATPase [Chloroflexia bacterium]|nr:AAA family ATPase [Chloroflexia bacterium]